MVSAYEIIFSVLQVNLDVCASDVQLFCNTYSLINDITGWNEVLRQKDYTSPM